MCEGVSLGTYKGIYYVIESGRPYKVVYGLCRTFQWSNVYVVTRIHTMYRSEGCPRLLPDQMEVTETQGDFSISDWD